MVILSDASTDTRAAIEVVMLTYCFILVNDEFTRREAVNRTTTLHLDDGPIKSFDDFGHSTVVQRIRRVTRLMIILVAVKGAVGDHDGRIVEFPVTLVVGKTNAGEKGYRGQ